MNDATGFVKRGQAPMFDTLAFKDVTGEVAQSKVQFEALACEQALREGFDGWIAFPPVKVMHTATGDMAVSHHFNLHHAPPEPVAGVRVVRIGPWGRA